jgi:hypothetical protein
VFDSFTPQLDLSFAAAVYGLIGLFLGSLIGELLVAALPAAASLCPLSTAPSWLDAGSRRRPDLAAPLDAKCVECSPLVAEKLVQRWGSSYKVPALGGRVQWDNRLLGSRTCTPARW